MRFNLSCLRVLGLPGELLGRRLIAPNRMSVRPREGVFKQASEDSVMLDELKAACGTILHPDRTAGRRFNTGAQPVARCLPSRFRAQQGRHLE